MPSDPSQPDPPPPPVGATPGRPGTDTGATTASTDDVAPHALPARSMLSGINLRALASLLVPLVIVGGDMGWWFLLIATVGVLIAGATRVLHWMRFRWGFDGQVLHVHSGLLWRQRRALDIGRIQQVEVERPILHRVLGTALLRVESASESGDTEIDLNGLEVERAEELRADIVAARRTRDGVPASTRGATTPGGIEVPPSTTSPGVPGDGPGTTTTPPPPVVTLARPSVADLVRHAITGSGLLVVPAALAALGQFLFELAGDQVDELASDAASTAAGLGVVVLAVVLVVVGLAGAIVVTLLRDWDLELVRDGDDLRLSRGLLEQRSATVPLHRLQVLEYRQNWVRRLFGVGTLQLRSAGGSSSDQDRRIIVPWVDREVLERVLAIGLRNVPGEHLPPASLQHPPAARRRLAWLWLRGFWIPLTIMAVTPLAVFADLRGAIGAGLVGALVVTALLAWLLSGAQYRRLGHAATDRVALVTGGVLGHTSTWMPLGRLQGVQARANPFQRRLDLVTLVLAPAGAGNHPVDIRDVGRERADLLGAHLVAVAAGRVAPVAPVDGPATA
ncbi:PH domain-containing protein [Salsipaludibacter albus]|uniref:PH domain-containing protein n=1 Tax=Salsipaludibacter albus TaxID=2849650 RepID=UPI001EE3B6EC|nr:PH domain-containing protein [Salsipaludibacter albus]MBY5161067.1 PH domain-containing protein [Salsipaludibacter albus]